LVLGSGYSTIKKLILISISIIKIKTEIEPNLIPNNPLVVVPKPMGYKSITHDYRLLFKSKKL
jgi:hypothetical protein